SLFFVYISRHLRDLHSFPTRRSSDLDATFGRSSGERSDHHPWLRGKRRTFFRILPALGSALAFWRRSERQDQPEHELRSSRRFQDRKSTRLNSSHRTTSYAVFCLKKK